MGPLALNFTSVNLANQRWPCPGVFLLTSGRQTSRLEDSYEDVWSEVSAGLNFFNFSETTSVFAKVDVTFGDDVSGVGGKAGMRVSW